MKKLITKLAVLALSLTLLISASACTPKEATQGITDTTITVGNTAAVSGDFAGVGLPFNAAIKAYFEQINTAGGVGGRTIQFKHYDDAFNSAQGKTNTEKLVYDDKVFALVGHFGTPTVGATLDSVIKKVGIPTVYYATGISALYQEGAKGKAKASMPVQPIYNTEGRMLVARAVKEFDNVTKIGVIFSDGDDGKGIKAGIERQMQDTAGVTAVYQQVAATSTNATAAVTAIKNAGVDVVICAMNQTPLTATFIELANQNVEVPVLTSYVNASVSTLGKVFDTDGTTVKTSGLSAYYTTVRQIYTNGWLDTSTTEGLNDYFAFAACINASTTLTEAEKLNYAVNAYAMAGYVAAHMFVQGLQRVAEGEEELTWNSYIAAMESAPVKVPMGGSVNYANGDRLGIASMNFSRFDVTTNTLVKVKDIMSLTEILAQQNV